MGNFVANIPDELNATSLHLLCTAALGCCRVVRSKVASCARFPRNTLLQ